MISTYTVAKINGFYFKAPDEFDQDHYEEILNGNRLSDAMDPECEDFDYLQLTDDITEAYPFLSHSYEKEIELPKYALFNDATYNKPTPNTKIALRQHFQRIYQTYNVVVLDIEEQIVHRIIDSH